MSYNVFITRNDIPQEDSKAWEIINTLDSGEFGNGSIDFKNLILKLTEKYPCICDLSDEELDKCVWSDGPLINNAGKDITVLGICNNIEEVVPFIIKTANGMNFVVFDDQIGAIFRPD